MDGIPWLFNKHLIVFYIREKGEDLLQVPFIYAIFWLQVHNLPMSFMSKGMAWQFGNFISQILKYDVALVMKGVKKFMFIKVILDAQISLKMKKRVVFLAE